AQRRQVEEARLGLARRLVEVRAELVARLGVALEKAVALREPQVGDLAIVTAHPALQVLERAPCFAVALRPEEDQGAAEIALRVRDDEILERSQRDARDRRGRGQRDFVIDALKR